MERNDMANSMANDTTNARPWTRLLTATHAALELWDTAVPFDADDEHVMAAMDELAAASAGVDLRQARTMDEAWLMLKNALELVNGV
jgi:hypothetical protein